MRIVFLSCISLTLLNPYLIPLFQVRLAGERAITPYQRREINHRRDLLFSLSPCPLSPPPFPHPFPQFPFPLFLDLFCVSYCQLHRQPVDRYSFGDSASRPLAPWEPAGGVEQFFRFTLISRPPLPRPSIRFTPCLHVFLFACPQELY